MCITAFQFRHYVFVEIKTQHVNVISEVRDGCYSKWKTLKIESAEQKLNGFERKACQIRIHYSGLGEQSLTTVDKRQISKILTAAICFCHSETATA